MTAGDPAGPLRDRLAPILGVAGSELALRRVPGGQSNLAWRADALDRSWFVRLGGGRDADLGIDRQAEWLALQAAAAAELAPRPVHAEAHTGLLITEWLDGQPWSRAMAVSADGIAKFARTLHHLHRLDIPPGLPVLDLGAAVRRLVHALPPGELPRASRQRLQARVDAWAPRAHHEPPRLCHNDLHHENILDDGRLRFVDWEYAAAGDPRVDLAAFATYHDLDPAQTNRLLAAYGNALDAGNFGQVCWLFDALHLCWLLVAGLTPATRSRFERLRSRLLL